MYFVHKHIDVAERLAKITSKSINSNPKCFYTILNLPSPQLARVFLSSLILRKRKLTLF